MITVWTVGHSTRSGEEFAQILVAHGVQVLVDVRSFPGSRRYPQFNRATLAESLKQVGIEYKHEPRLGGRRTSYADHIESEEFRSGVNELLQLAANAPTAVMCAESHWRRCHRRLISDYLKAAGHTIIHILNQNKTEEHPVTLF
jgi:uncharacterized protein (DUF488 family)